MAKATRYTEELIAEYTQKGTWDGTRLCDIWDKSARDFPDRIALSDSARRLSYREANLWIDRLALGLLEQGLRKDDLLVVQLPNSVELTLLRAACEKAGLLCLPILRTLRHTEVEYILRATGAAAIVTPCEFHGFDHCRMIQDLRPGLPQLRYAFAVGGKVPPGFLSLDDMLANPLEKQYPADYLETRKCPSTEFSFIAHTTGTTGFPKFVEYPACCRISQARRNLDYFGIGGDDVFGLLGPAALGPNNLGYFGAPIVGARVALLEKFEPADAFRLIQEEKVTIACVVPTILALIMRHPQWQDYDCRSVRYWWCTGSSMNYKIAEEVEEKLGGTVINVLGAVDFGGECVTPPRASREVRMTTAGRPLEGVTEIRLMGEGGREVTGEGVGEIQGRGPSCVSGYFKDPEATWKTWTKDGWYSLGDLGRWDAEGNLVVVGRKKDMIIRGGQNIYPIELETLIMTHPRVLEAAMVGYPDEIMGERACLFVVPRSGEPVDLQEITAFLKGKGIASFKLPERLEILEKLPLAAEQKIDKKKLRELLL